MKAFKLRTDGYLFRFLCVFGTKHIRKSLKSEYIDSSINTCSITRSLIWGIIKAILYIGTPVILTSLFILGMLLPVGVILNHLYFIAILGFEWMPWVAPSGSQNPFDWLATLSVFDTLMASIFAIITFTITAFVVGTAAVYSFIGLFNAVHFVERKVSTVKKRTKEQYESGEKELPPVLQLLKHRHDKVCLPAKLVKPKED